MPRSAGIGGSQTSAAHPSRLPQHSPREALGGTRLHSESQRPADRCASWPGTPALGTRPLLCPSGSKGKGCWQPSARSPPPRRLLLPPLPPRIVTPAPGGFCPFQSPFKLSFWPRNAKRSAGGTCSPSEAAAAGRGRGAGGGSDPSPPGGTRGAAGAARPRQRGGSQGPAAAGGAARGRGAAAGGRAAPVPSSRPPASFPGPALPGGARPSSPGREQPGGEPQGREAALARQGRTAPVRPSTAAQPRGRGSGRAAAAVRRRRGPERLRPARRGRRRHGGVGPR